MSQGPPLLTLDDLLGRLEGVKRMGPSKAQARCPAHADRDPSMTVREGTTCLLMHCFAGCSFEDICRALGIQSSQLLYEVIEHDGRRVVRKPFWQREAAHMQQLNTSEGSHPWQQ